MPHKSAECRARSRPWLPLKRFPCRAVPRSAWSECVGLKRLAAQDPLVTFSQSRPEKEGPRRRSISICDSRPVAESYILPLYNHSRHLKIRRRPVSAIGGFEPFGFDLCGVASFVADTANGPWEFVGNSLVQIENHYFRHGAWLKIGDISNAHRVGDTLLRKCRPASNRGHENAQ